MKEAVFYHAGCAICKEAELQLLDVLDKQLVALRVINLAESPSEIEPAEELGVKSVPALVLDGGVFHINYGASVDDVKAKGVSK
ncbi:thioredoxin family protein [Hahella ganghwensis]|uniref:thioredoxin family protein n=1 Tax=Hahella ganghwensis TaxID=286420 RepID=UPI00036DF52B|nr:thioredoxin family protein [Hahella ganghwensis]